MGLTQDNKDFFEEYIKTISKASGSKDDAVVESALSFLMLYDEATSTIQKEKAYSILKDNGLGIDRLVTPDHRPLQNAGYDEILDGQITLNMDGTYTEYKA